MLRLKSLLTELRSKFPDDSYLKHHDLKIKESLVLRRLQGLYERVLATLDDDAWRTLRKKSIRNFPLGQSIRGKQALYDHLNEAFAYRFLLRSGCSNISFLDNAETLKKKGMHIKSPDLRFTQDGAVRYCEVKTINISNDQLAREILSGVAHDSSIFELHEPFFAKFKDNVLKAIGQFESFGGSGIIYFLIHSDDRALDDLEVNKVQIADFMNSYFPGVEMFVKFGIYGRFHLRV